MDRVALVVGEALVDVVRRDGREQALPGGSAANAAVAMSRLGREVWLATAWADDAYGAMLAAHLVDNGVHLAADPAVLGRTSSATASLGADGAARYEFDISWRLGDIALPPGAEPAVVACGSIAAVLEPGASSVLELLERWRGRALTYYDVNARPQVTGEDVSPLVEQVVARSDLVKASDEDLSVVWPATSEDDVVARLLAGGAGAVVVTRGGDGATWWSAQGRVDVPGVPVEVADTIGAGDTLGAAVVHDLWRRGVAGPGAGARLARMGLDEGRAVLDFATRAAAITVSRAGADPPYARELAVTPR